MRKTNTTNTRKTVLWWNEECKKASHENKQALYKYRKHPTMDNLILLKKARALIRTSKINSKNKFTVTINPETPIKLIWRKIRRIKGKSIASTTMLIDKTHEIISPQEIANKLAETFEATSSDDQYNIEFLALKQSEEEIYLNFNIEGHSPINFPFTMSEIHQEIQNLKIRSSPGPDGIPYIMINNLPLNTLQHLLTIYNLIWTANTYPDQWKEVI